MKRGMVAALCAAVFITGCSGEGSDYAKNSAVTEESYESSEGFYNEDALEEEYEDVEEKSTEDVTESENENTSASESSSTGKKKKNSQKLIRTIDMDVETLDFEETITFVEAEVEKIGGYFENMQMDGVRLDSEYDLQSASLRIRVPKDKADEFLDKVSQKTNVYSRSESVEDVTLHYVDVESHKKALQTEQERILAIMEKAEKMSDIIELEERLSEIRYELQNYESTLRSIDNQVDYTTIEMRVSEVREETKPEPEGVFERIGNGFVRNLRNVGNGLVNFFIWFITNLPYFVVWGAVIAGIVWVVRLIRKKRREKKEKKRALREQQMNQQIQNQNQDKTEK